MSGPLTTAVIVTYQSRGLVNQTMRVARKAYEAGLLECIVIDNASTDGTVAFLEEEHAWAEIVASQTNVGFARGCNLGLRYVATQYVLFLNPDAMLEPEALSELVRFMEEHPKAGVIAPAIVDPRGGLQAAGGLPTPWSIIAAAAGLSRWGIRQRPIVPGEAAFQVDWLCGAILLARKKLMDDLGGFDPRFFLYFEETDLCRRARQRGAELCAVGEVVAAHVDGAIVRNMQVPLYNGCIAEHYFRSRFYYLVKHYGWIAAACAEIAELALMAGRALPRRLLGRGNREFLARLRAPVLSLPPKDS